MLDELSPETRALLQHARDTGAPLGAKTRVWQGLESRLALTAAGGVAARTLTAFAKTAFAAAAAVAVGALGLRLSTREATKPASIVAPPPPPAFAAEPPPAPVAEPSPAMNSVASPPRPVHVVVPSRLSEETALLAQVNIALRDGQPSRALALLGVYDRRFSGGELRPERSAARVFALCSLGRSASARAEAARFLKAWPRSPLTARVSSSCARGD